MIEAVQAVAGLGGMALAASFGLGVAARREVTSVLLVSRVPAPRIRTLAAHTASRTSVALARLLLRERWDAEPDVVPARPPLASMMALADAAVIIGDPALAVHGRTGMLEVDLARAWVEWTGLPFVFAVWGVAAGAPTGLDALLVSSLAYAERRWESMIPVWAAEHGVGEAETRRYLGEAITYRLTGEERRGMEEFLERGALAGLLPARTGVWRAG